MSSVVYLVFNFVMSHDHILWSRASTRGKSNPHKLIWATFTGSLRTPFPVLNKWLMGDLIWCLHLNKCGGEITASLFIYFVVVWWLRKRSLIRIQYPWGHIIMWRRYRSSIDRPQSVVFGVRVSVHIFGGRESRKRLHIMLHKLSLARYHRWRGLWRHTNRLRSMNIYANLMYK